MRTSKMFSLLMIFTFFSFGKGAVRFGTEAHAQFDDAGFKQALKLKKNAYTSEGSITGGSRETRDFIISQIRVAANPAGYDRIVLEIEGNAGGEKSAVSAPPFYLVENDPSNKLVIVTLYGKAKLDFSRQMATQQARKAKLISKLDFLAEVTEDRWTWTIHTEVPVRAEVFELSSPARIIIDLKP
jgi:hypothetical protein